MKTSTTKTINLSLKMNIIIHRTTCNKKWEKRQKIMRWFEISHTYIKEEEGKVKLLICEGKAK